MPPSARGSSSGLRRVSGLVKPRLAPPAGARAVHHPAVARVPTDLAPALERDASRGDGGGAPGALVLPRSGFGFASRSSLSDAGGTRTAPGHRCTTLTSRIGATRAWARNLV